MEKHKPPVHGDKDENMLLVVIVKLRFVKDNAFTVRVFMGKLTFILDGLQRILLVLSLDKVYLNLFYFYRTNSSKFENDQKVHLHHTHFCSYPLINFEGTTRNFLTASCHVFFLESHVTNFEDYGYTFICHMGNEDRKVLKKNVTSMHYDKEKEIEINGGAGEIGIKVFRVAQWKAKCKNYFNRYYKTSSIIAVPSDRDRIMNAFSFLCSENQGRGFVFKNYDIAKHLEFLGYDKATLKAKLGQTQTRKYTSYVAYVEQKNVIYICEKILNGSNMSQCLNNISVFIKYFLTLYNRELETSGGML